LESGETLLHVWIAVNLAKLWAYGNPNIKLHFIASNKITLCHDFVKSYQSGIKQTETLYGEVTVNKKVNNSH
jgi:hypothetical protein